MKSLLSGDSVSSSFPALSTVAGSLNLNMSESANATSVTFPNLVEVRGSMAARFAAGFDCNQLRGWRGGVVLGDFSCQSGGWTENAGDADAKNASARRPQGDDGIISGAGGSSGGGSGSVKASGVAVLSMLVAHFTFKIQSTAQ